MMRSIRIDDGVYQALRDLQRPRESYGDVIERLVKAQYPEAMKSDAPEKSGFTSLGNAIAGAGVRKEGHA